MIPKPDTKPSEQALKAAEVIKQNYTFGKNPDFNPVPGLAAIIDRSFAAMAQDRRNKSGIISDWQRFAAALSKVLGCSSIDDDILKQAKALVKERDELREALQRLVNTKGLCGNKLLTDAPLAAKALNRSKG